MTTITAEIQKLEPGAVVDVFELDATMLGGNRVLFHGYTQFEDLYWQGLPYSVWPIEATGFDRTTDRPASPKLSVGNVNGSITALCLALDDLVGAKLTRRRTLGRFLDAANFAGGNPEANPNEELTSEIWYVERKSLENASVVEFELSSALDFNGVQLPRRQIIANMCPWVYRSTECGYVGGPVATINDAATANPLLDKCSKKIIGCKFRFGADQPLSFGGFPAAGLIR